MSCRSRLIQSLGRSCICWDMDGNYCSFRIVDGDRTYRLWKLSQWCDWWCIESRLVHEHMMHNSRNCMVCRRYLLSEWMKNYAWRKPCKIQSCTCRRWARLSRFDSWAWLNKKNKFCSLENWSKGTWSKIQDVVRLASEANGAIITCLTVWHAWTRKARFVDWK